MAILDNISARHQELIGGIIKNLGNAEIDWEAVAKDANFSSAKYAKDEYRKVRKALDGGSGGSPVKAKAKAKAKATPKKRKGDDAETPATKTKKTKKGKKATSSSEEDGEKDTGDIKAEEEQSDSEGLV